MIPIIDDDDVMIMIIMIINNDHDECIDDDTNYEDHINNDDDHTIHNHTKIYEKPCNLSWTTVYRFLHLSMHQELFHRILVAAPSYK